MCPGQTSFTVLLRRVCPWVGLLLSRVCIMVCLKYSGQIGHEDEGWTETPAGGWEAPPVVLLLTLLKKTDSDMAADSTVSSSIQLGLTKLLLGTLRPV